jgi:hypothetical protein
MTYNSQTWASSSCTTKPPPPASNDVLAAYYWPRHFEVGSVEPAPFIHQIMTDYGDDDIVGHWIQNMSPLYRLYNVCVKYGLEYGSPNKRIELQKFPGVKL